MRNNKKEWIDSLLYTRMSWVLKSHVSRLWYATSFGNPVFFNLSYLYEIKNL